MKLSLRSMKKSLVSAFLLVLAFSSFNSTSTYAASDFKLNPTTAEIDNYLIEAGYPVEAVKNVYFPDQKKELYRSQAKFVSLKNDEGILLADHQQTTQPGVISPLNISPDNFTNYITLSEVTGTISAGQARFSITYNWIWAADPTYTLTDKFGIAWTDDFDAVPSTSRTQYSAFGNIPGTSTQATFTSPLSNTYSKYTAGAGIGWEVDLKGTFTVNGTAYATYLHQGWSMIDIVKAHDSSGNLETTSMSATYFHKYGTIDANLTFSKTPEVSLSNSFNYDQSNDLGYAFKWYKKDPSNPSPL